MQLSCYSRRANQARRRVICLVGVLALGLSYGQDARAEERTPSSIAVHIERGLLSVDAHNAPLGEVLEAIAKQANFQLDTKGDLDVPVTWSFANVPVDEAVQRLLQNVSSVITYARSRNGGPTPLAKVTTFRRKVDPAANSVQVARTIPPPQTQKATKVEEPQHEPTVRLDDDREDRLRAVRWSGDRRPQSPRFYPNLGSLASGPECPRPTMISSTPLWPRGPGACSGRWPPTCE